MHRRTQSADRRVWLTPVAAVNRRLRAAMRHLLQDKPRVAAPKHYLWPGSASRRLVAKALQRSGFSTTAMTVDDREPMWLLPAYQATGQVD